VLDDHPLISRIVTVTGETLSQPQNVLALIGTPVSALLDNCGFAPQSQQRVIMGGPMMGFTLPDLAVPVVKTTNCILAPTAEELPAASQEMDCIRCSSCADACPASLLPQQLLWYSKAHDSEKLKEYNLADCIECGACAYVCPSEIPLVQYYRVAKAEIREQQREALKAEQAKARFEARNARLEQEKQQRAERNQQLVAARQQQQLASGANNAVADALARIKAKQAQTNDTNDNNATAAVQAERERKKQQAREYQQQKALATNEQTNATELSDTNSKAAVVAAALARAKARNAAEPNAATSDTPEPLHAEPAADPRKAAIAAAIARAKAKQQTATTETTESVDEATVPDASASAPESDPRKAAIAAAIARAKAKKQTDSENS
jgi:electron transport complex protein RnfC